MESTLILQNKESWTILRYNFTNICKLLFKLCGLILLSSALHTICSEENQNNNPKLFDVLQKTQKNDEWTILNEGDYSFSFIITNWM